MEKAKQVQDMQKIYEHAEKVIVWLDVDSWGKLETDCISKSSSFISRMAKMSAE